MPLEPRQSRRLHAQLTRGFVVMWFALSACGSEVAAKIDDVAAEVADTSLEFEADVAEIGEDPNACGKTELAPPPVMIEQGWVVPMDVTRLDVAVRFDVAQQRAPATARMSFVMGPSGGMPVFDWHETPISIQIDGRTLPLESLHRVELAASPTGGVLALLEELPACSRHTLVIDFEMAITLDFSAMPRWDDAGVSWTSAFSDNEPGVLLERWLPAPLIHDGFELAFDVRVDNAAEHVFLANTAAQIRGSNRWFAHWSNADASTPLWYLRPAAQVVHWPDPTGRVELYFGVDFPEARPEEWLAIAQASLAEFTTRFGRRVGHEAPYLLIFEPFGQLSRGMEYSNAAMMAPGFRRDGIQHEILHAWLGRSLRPGRHIDAWWDEGAVMFFERTMSDASPLDPFDPAAASFLDADPWARRVPWQAYHLGADVFATVAELLGRERTEAILRDWVERCPHGHITHHDLKEVFAATGHREAIEALFDNWVIPPGDRVVHGDCTPLPANETF